VVRPARRQPRGGRRIVASGLAAGAGRSGSTASASSSCSCAVRRSRSAAACSWRAAASRPAADLSFSSASWRSRSACSRFAARRRLGVPTTKKSSSNATTVPPITATHTQKSMPDLLPAASATKRMVLSDALPEHACDCLPGRPVAISLRNANGLGESPSPARGKRDALAPEPFYREASSAPRRQVAFLILLRKRPRGAADSGSRPSVNVRRSSRFAVRRGA
jgi:hypothetical protein